VARTRTGDPTPEGTTEQPLEGQEVFDIPAPVDPAEQEIEAHKASGQVGDAHVMEMTAQAAQRAAAWVQTKGYGASMTTLIQYIAAHAVDTAELNAVIMEQMAIRILNATSPEEILDPFATVKGEDLVGRPLEIRSAMFLEGDKNEGFPWYTTLTVYDAQTNREFPVTIGGEKLVPQVAGFDMHDVWPQVIEIAEYKTRAGFTGYELARVRRMPF
jgi:hypothetical protein